MEVLLSGIIWLLIWQLPLCGLLFAAYAVLTVPLRKQERVRAFLMLIDTKIKNGRRVEDTLIAAAATRDPGLGRGFRSLETFLRSGLPLSQALARVPGFLPARVTAMLHAGEKMGDLQKVLPACRHTVKDPLLPTRGAMHYLLIAAFLTTPAAFIILRLLQIWVFPQMNSVCLGLGATPPAGLRILAEQSTPLYLLEAGLLAIVWLTSLVYIGGPTLFAFLDPFFSSLLHPLHYALPWHRKKMLRDFSSLLAILLDAGVPEREALTLAADCTGNNVFRERARRAMAALAQGTPLTESFKFLDDTGEFRWRLTNAIHARGGFFQAIATWIESLDAKAFQQEQAAAQMIGTGIILLNGLFVGFLVTSVFGVLVAIINGSVLW